MEQTQTEIPRLVGVDLASVPAPPPETQAEVAFVPAEELVKKKKRHEGLAAQVLPETVMQLLTIVPENEIVRAWVLSIVKKPIPPDLKTGEQIIEWIETVDDLGDHLGCEKWLPTCEFELYHKKAELGQVRFERTMQAVQFYLLSPEDSGAIIKDYLKTTPVGLRSWRELTRLLYQEAIAKGEEEMENGAPEEYRPVQHNYRDYDVQDVDRRWCECPHPYTSYTTWVREHIARNAPHVTKTFRD